MHELKCKIPKQYVCKLSLLQECKSKLPLDLTDVNNYINQLEEKKMIISIDAQKWTKAILII
jgi:hypothetical protein